MSDGPHRFEPGGTPGGRWGCAAAALFMVCCLPLLGMLVWAIHGMADWFLYGWLPTLVMAACFGLAVRLLVNGARRWRGGDEDAPTPVWAPGLVLLAVIAAVALYYTLFANWWFGAS